jgi:hypothetical protein
MTVGLVATKSTAYYGDAILLDVAFLLSALVQRPK